MEKIPVWGFAPDKPPAEVSRNDMAYALTMIRRGFNTFFFGFLLSVVLWSTHSFASGSWILAASTTLGCVQVAHGLYVLEGGEVKWKFAIGLLLFALFSYLPLIPLL